MPNHYAPQASAHYGYAQPQGPPSPPMDDTSKCSLPSISNLLGLADGGSPTSETSQASLQGKSSSVSCRVASHILLTPHSFVPKGRHTTKLIPLQQRSCSWRRSAPNTPHVLGGFFRRIPLPIGQVCQPAPNAELLLRLAAVHEPCGATRAAPSNDLQDACSARVRGSCLRFFVHVEPCHGFLLPDHAANAPTSATGFRPLLPATIASG